ncbi:hypothetical protein DIE19_29465 [Burkholderia sp. Bp9126]|nr:hypothetical protein DIE19_29465 [Burkholderia sp. Bp9126]
MAQKLPSRRPRSKAELLPLPAALVRDISLENHLALATIRAGHGTPDRPPLDFNAFYRTCLT